MMEKKMLKFNDEDSLIKNDSDEYLSNYQEIYQKIKNKDSIGSEYLGWHDLLSSEIDNALLTKINDDVKRLQQKAKTMIVIGIGGSYLGAKAVACALQNQILKNEYNLIFLGQNMASSYIYEVVEFCKENDFVVNVISKSGTTLEPALSFRLIKDILIKKYGEDSLKERLIITTDREKGTLKEFAINNNLDTYIIPDDIGGRFSVFTPVGLLPLAFINLDILSFLKGGRYASSVYFVEEKNNAYRYALDRYLMHQNDKKIEAFVVYEPSLMYFIEWIKQLFGESEGKDKKGLFPVGMLFSTDLHSLGQYIQEGQKSLFETIIKIKKSKHDFELPFDKNNEDKLNGLREHTISKINLLTLDAVKKAHVKGEVPNLVIEIEKIDEYNLGYLMSFMMYVCTYSSYMLKVNPFNQPGVEVYKQEIYKIL